MKYAKLAKLWDSLHFSFWSVLTLMVVLAIATKEEAIAFCRGEVAIDSELSFSNQDFLISTNY